MKEHFPCNSTWQSNMIR